MLRHRRRKESLTHPASIIMQMWGGDSFSRKGYAMLRVQWIKSRAGTWLPLQTLDLSSVRSDGVYLIWHAGQPARVVRLGQGDVRDRLGAHRNDREITGYVRFGRLLVTWASVPAVQRDGVERYLADTWPPLVGDAFPNVRPIAVNSPW